MNIFGTLLNKDTYAFVCMWLKQVVMRKNTSAWLTRSSCYQRRARGRDVPAPPVSSALLASALLEVAPESGRPGGTRPLVASWDQWSVGKISHVSTWEEWTKASSAGHTQLQHLLACSDFSHRRGSRIFTQSQHDSLQVKCYSQIHLIILAYLLIHSVT